MSWKIKKKQGQSTMEMALMLPIFMVIMFGCFDLALMQTALIDTMSVARNTIRTMSLTKTGRSGGKALCVATSSMNFLGARVSAPFVTFTPYNGNTNCSNENMTFGTGGNGKGGFSVTNGSDYNLSNGGGALNAPQLVQLCSKVKPIIPAIWGEKEVKICASYFSFRQYQDY